MYTCEARVGVSEVGRDGRQTLISILDRMQDCSQFWLESEPRLSDYMKAHQVALFLSSRQLDVLGYAGYGERISVKTSIYDCTGYFGYRNTVLYGEDGRPLALSWCQGVFVDLRSGTPTKLPGEALKQVQFDERLSMEYLPRKIRLPREELLRLSVLQPSPFDVDLNGHVNNVRYVQRACECLPGYERYDRVRVEYKTPTGPGTPFFPFISTAEGRGIVKLSSDTGETYCIVEFSKRGK